MLEATSNAGTSAWTGYCVSVLLTCATLSGFDLAESMSVCMSEGLYSTSQQLQEQGSIPTGCVLGIVKVFLFALRTLQHVYSGLPTGAQCHSF